MTRTTGKCWIVLPFISLLARLIVSAELQPGSWAANEIPSSRPGDEVHGRPVSAGRAGRALSAEAPGASSFFVLWSRRKIIHLGPSLCWLGRFVVSKTTDFSLAFVCLFVCFEMILEF